MKLSQQALLGTAVLLGGSVLLYATVHQVISTPAATPNDNTAHVASASAAMPTAGSALTADMQTEQNILAAKQQEREQWVAQQEQQAQQYLTEQQKIEAAAIARSRAENQLYVSKNASATEDSPAGMPITEPVVTPRPVQAANPVTKSNAANQSNNVATPVIKNAPNPNLTSSQTATVEKKTIESRPSRYQVKAGEGLIGIAQRYNVPLDVLAEMNGLSRTTSLRVGQTLKIPTDAQVNELRQQAAAKEREKQQIILQKQQEALRKEQEKQAYQAAQAKLKEARQSVKETDAKGSFGVQVALAANDANAQTIVKQLQAAGYKVKTSPTSRGVRVVVGPETGKAAALALKDKINNDPRVNVDNGWVLYW